MGVMDTDPQVLTNLQEIRSLLQALVTIGIVIAAAVVIRVLLVMYSTWRQIQKEGFEDKASALYRDGRLDDLVQACHERAALHSADPYPHYYLGIVEFDRGHDAPARAHFDKTLALAPTWRSHVASYLERLNERATPAASLESAHEEA
jgi:hypothetical protein